MMRYRFSVFPWVLLPLLQPLFCSSMITSRPTTRRSVVNTVSSLSVTTQNVIYDGPEWSSLQECLRCKSEEMTDYGRMTVVVGTTEQGDKVVGIVAVAADDGDNQKTNDRTTTKTVPLTENNLHIYRESMAQVPSNINDQEAIQTMIAALTGVHCVVPKIEGVGGASRDDSNMVSGKVVILGGSDYACFAAEGLATLGSSVSVVSTKNPSIKHKNVEVMSPAIGDDDLGFASFVGKFESLLDTAQNERPSRRPFIATDDDEDNDDDDDDNTSMHGNMVLRLLKERHSCERYISSMTQAQKIVNSEGVFFGPGKVKQHFQDLQQKLKAQPTMFQPIIPPVSFGHTVQMLLENGVIYKSNKEFLSNKDVTARGWSLQDFVEVNTWPQSSVGGGIRSVRYGLPIIEDVEEEEEEDAMISAPPELTSQKFFARDQWDDDIGRKQRARDKEDEQNPYVKKIVGAKGLHEDIVKREKNAVLFMSAAWCRTCRSLNPKFTYLARQKLEQCQNAENDHNPNGILFAKADTTGEGGTDLGRLLNVDAVPAFLLFRKGRRFGPPLSISKIPSKKLKVAIELLESGLEWDSDAVSKALKKSR